MTRVSDNGISMYTNKVITFFLTDEIEKTLIANDSFDEISAQVSNKTAHQDWQEIFCQSINYHSTQIPWNLLRAKKFNLSDDIKTIVCCDPVSIQMTHRGAYCWGQKPLSINRKDAVYIIDQINKILMCDGEQFLLSDDLKWLYVSTKSRSLAEPSFERLIGKDLFDFRYQGSNATQWSHLATEIQMLVKQLMDFKRIESTPPETSVSVHFWGDSELTMDRAFPTKDIQQQQKTQQNTVVYSSNDKLNYFVHQNNLPVKTPQNLDVDNVMDPPISNAIVVLPSFSLPLVETLKKSMKNYSSVRIITQDKIFSQKKSLCKTLSWKIFSFIKPKKSQLN